MFGSPLGPVFRHSDAPLRSFSPCCRFPRPAPERVFVVDHQSGPRFSGTSFSARQLRPIGTLHSGHGERPCLQSLPASPAVWSAISASLPYGAARVRLWLIREVRSMPGARPVYPRYCCKTPSTEKPRNIESSPHPSRQERVAASVVSILLLRFNACQIVLQQYPPSSRHWCAEGACGPSGWCGNH